MYMLLKYNQILTEGEGQCTGLHAVCSKPDTSCVLYFRYLTWLLVHSNTKCNRPTHSRYQQFLIGLAQLLIKL